MLEQAGVPGAEITSEDRLHSINQPNDWWTIVCGSGYRGTIEQLNPADYAAVRDENLNYLQEHAISGLQTNALYAVATKVRA
jgi:hypothetical protein